MWDGKLQDFFVFCTSICMIFFCYTYVYLGILYYIFFIYVWVFPAMNDEEIERLLNGSDFDFSEDDDEDEYLPSEFLQNIY